MFPHQDNTPKYDIDVTGLRKEILRLPEFARGAALDGSVKVLQKTLREQRVPEDVIRNAVYRLKRGIRV